MHRLARAIALCTVLACVAAGAAAADAPRLQIDTGGHGAFIHALALDERNGLLYSASEDKTVRVWRRADGRLLDTYRVPGGDGAEGQLYALALRPDGAQLAVAGWTCWDRERRACVYLLDAQTGAIQGRIAGLEEVVASLRYSPDGRHLAVGLMGDAGLRVVRVADGVRVAEDRAYRGKLLELDFSRDGVLVTGALDGFLRIYDTGFVLRGRVNAGLAGHEPFGLRFSPDGRHVAVGFNDVARVSVLNADLSPLVTLAAAGASGLKNLTRVAWSAAGDAIYAAGEPREGGRAGLFRWSLATPALAVALPFSARRLGELLVDRQDFVWFGTDDPALGLLEPTGILRWRQASGIVRLTGRGATLAASEDGAIVQFGGGTAAAQRRFNVTTASLERAEAAGSRMVPTRLTAPGWSVSELESAAGPLINGRRLALGPYEIARCYAIAADAGRAVVGSEWMLRMIDRGGRVQWSRRTATRVDAVASTSDGRFVIAALADGTVNWFRADDGRPWLSLFVHADGVNWAAWLPGGEYASSPYGDTFVGWQVDRGATTSPDFYRAVQFERELYRPDLVKRRLAAASDSSAGDATRLLAIAPPHLDVRAMPPGVDGRRRIRVTAERRGAAMRDLVVYVNDVPVTPSRERELGEPESARFVREFALPFDGPDVTVRAEVFTDRSLGVGERVMPPVPATRSAPGDLYVLAIGSNRFPDLDPSTTLAYAAKDAQEFARAVAEAGRREYRHVDVRVLSDDGELPMRRAIVAALETLKRARGEDTVIVFMASHGISDDAGEYYFVPRDARRTDVDAVLDNRPLGLGHSLLGWRPIFDALRQTAGRRILIVDTCHARNVTGRFEDAALVKRSASSRLAFLLAAGGTEESQEYEPAAHGLFTYALLEPLKPLRAGAGSPLEIETWFARAAAQVEQLRDRRIGPQTPQFVSPPALSRSVLFSP